jgi:hypothetical protein
MINTHRIHKLDVPVCRSETFGSDCHSKFAVREAAAQKYRRRKGKEIYKLEKRKRNECDKRRKRQELFANPMIVLNIMNGRKIFGATDRGNRLNSQAEQPEKGLGD